MQVKDVMSRNPITIDPEAPLATAMAVMKKEGIRHLPVTDDTGRLLGIITDRDLRSAAFAPALIEHLRRGRGGRLRLQGPRRGRRRPPSAGRVPQGRVAHAHREHQGVGIRMMIPPFVSRMAERGLGVAA
jgi:hypothetical protein